MEQITIAGSPFNVPVRYSEGHELTEGEASALNQTFHENIRNNLAKKAKDGSLTQEDVDSYAQSYQFGVRAAGMGVSRDPVRAEALNLAKAQIRAALTKAGRKAEPKVIAEAAGRLIDDPARGGPLLAAAKKRVEEKQAIAGANLDDLLGDLGEAAPAEAPAAA